MGTARTTKADGRTISATAKARLCMRTETAFAAIMSTDSAKAKASTHSSETAHSSSDNGKATNSYRENGDTATKPNSWAPSTIICPSERAHSVSRPTIKTMASTQTASGDLCPRCSTSNDRYLISIFEKFHLSNHMHSLDH